MAGSLPITPGGGLCPAGYELRETLAECGFEMTPQQLIDALLEAERILEARYGPDYGSHRDAVYEEMDRAIGKRFCRSAPSPTRRQV